MNVGGDLHLTYCSNIHPGETWQAVDEALRSSLPRIRAILDFDGPFAIGLRLSAAAAETLERPETMARFRAFLDGGNYYVPTINGFPYGAFHGQRVKANVYLPDWRDPARVEYTNRLARLLADLLVDRKETAGTISTVPGAFRANVRSDGDVVAIASNILRHASSLVSLRSRTGVAISLALEPEPACFIETVDDAVRFFSAYLFDQGLVAAVATETAVAMTVDDVRRHVGICLDACHMAVEFEDPGAALQRLRDTEIRVCKVQVSSALRLDDCSPAEIGEALRPFAEDTYLHQVVERRGSALTRYVDLPEGLAAAGADPSDARRDWRVHFHVPIFLEAMKGFHTTQGYLAALLGLVRREHACNCFEVETYTWDVLPPEYRTVDVCTAIARELSWARTRLTEGP